ncbi:hypothetical protein SSABA_v1c03750 [Spiroplasma sabaudiense Ar-1343]|uniref:Uncharacterized protein n=1 Tax=Spiroplasma sabaudiense Ar-1343 TaxID=1276257 RepID=W6AJ91_9MOLU|nr:ABC transporter permease [Spiroplasma sabaudiense]AHI53784.1 hypothetical protein SSABA_v1c03750 [Spiroplasma sabaudiense Ar-1343]
MNQGFKVVFRFSFLRIIKNKVFIILSTITLALIILIQSLTMNIGDNILYKNNIGLIFIVVLGIFWLSFVNIGNVASIAITDNRNGIQSLENRRGLKNSSIFWAKFLPLKIVTTTFICLVYLIYVIISAISPVYLKDFIIINLGTGLLSLVAYDFLIFGVTLFLAASSKSLKRTLPAVWILTTLFMFFAIFGPIFFALASDDRTSNNYSPIIKNAKELQGTQNEEDRFLTELYKSMNELEEIFEENITSDRSHNDTYLFSHWFIIWQTFDSGMLPYFGELIEEDAFATSIEKYFNKFETNLEEQKIEINEIELKKRIKDNLYYQFIKEVSVKSQGDKIKNFKNSFYYKNSSKNYNKPQQLKEVLTNLKNVDRNKFDISDNELAKLHDSLINMFKFEWSIYSNEEILNIDPYGRPDTKNIFYNYQFWINDSRYSPGTYLFNLLNYELLGYFDMEIKVGDYFQWTPKAIWNYRANPFMWFYEMVYFSGKNNPEVNYFMSADAPLPIAQFSFYDLDSQGELIYSQRPFSVWANYLVFIGMGSLLIGLGYRAFCKTKDERKLVD